MLGMFVALMMSGALLVACGGSSGPDSPSTGSDTTGTSVVADTSGATSDSSTSATTDVNAPEPEDTGAPTNSDAETPAPLSDADAGESSASDADECSGAWESCCINGVVDQCCCPEGMACNYGMFESCEDGSCVDPGEACSGPEADASSSEDTTTTEDAGESCDGAWESCCVDGVIGQCCCPEGMACNYGMFESCEDGSCAPIGMTCEEEKEEDASVTPDVVEPADVVGPTEDTSEPADASGETCDGAWQQCCVDGAVEQCCCPEGAICNFFYQTCEDGSCVFPGAEECPPPEPVCDGNWETCCVDGVVDQCCCPEGMACNYGMFETCEDGSCVGPMEECAPPEPVCDGTWQDCCVDGAIEQCCCPEGAICNYFFDMCEDGSCAFGEPCPPPEPEPECDGTWQDCCVDGVVDQCCCPEGVACNYGMFQTCEDGSCVGPAEECKAKD